MGRTYGGAMNMPASQHPSGNAAVIFDRDGVLNRSEVRDGRPYAPKRLADFDILPGVAEAVTTLRAASFKLFVATNQPDAATGLTPVTEIEAMHERLNARFHFDGIYVCYHTESDCCSCRKPKPGLLLKAARDHNIDLKRSFMVGDRWRDVLAGAAVGCRTVFVDHGYDEQRPVESDAIVRDITEVAAWILRAHRRSMRKLERPCPTSTN